MTILERDEYLAQLEAYLQDAAAGRGHLVFLSGEAGGGKTTVAKRFALTVGQRAPVAICSCDGFGIHRPFSGLLDIAGALGPDVQAALNEQASRDRVFSAVLAALRNAPGANVVVGEDAHWSDEASLDLIRFVGRRIANTHTLFIVTYRDDALGPYHPLRRVLGDLVNEPAVSRIALSPLSNAAVSTLAAGTGIDPDALYQRTGGNPFFVTEILGSGDTEVPASIRDAVLARAAGISAESRAVLDAAAAIDLVVDPELLARVVGGPIEDAVDECLAAGMLTVAGDEIAFRHALTRDVILSSMSPPRRRSLHRRILHLLVDDPPLAADVPRLAHHAEEAGDRVAVLRYAPAAAREAANFGAHREAAAQYDRALRFAQGLPDSEVADLLEVRSYECYLTAQLDDAFADLTRAISLRQALGDSLKVGDDLRWLSRYCWFAGRNAEAERHARAALDVLESLPPGLELARAYSNLSQLRMLAYDAAEAIHWGECAILLAHVLDDRPTLAHALINVGTARLTMDENGRREIEQGAQIARETGQHDDVSRAYTNLAYQAMQHYELADVEHFTGEGLAFTAEHDLIAMELYLRAIRSQLWLARGMWDEAVTEAREVADHPRVTVPSRIVAHTVCGLVRARRGKDPAADLDEALRLAEQTGEFMRMEPLRAAQAEVAWLAGDSELAAAEADREYANALRIGDRWIAGRLALWLHRGGRRVIDVARLAEPYALEIAGNGAAAARLWHKLGCPLEEARALEATGDEASLRAALVIVDRLDAKPDMARIVRALRRAGVTSIPRGPRPSTRANAAQLTARELDVLARVVQGQSNRAIADALYLSPKTVGHHVSAILAKLAISSRSEARERVEALGLFQDGASSAPN